MKKIFSLLVLFCFFTSNTFSQTSKSDCKKRIKIKGIPYDGKQWIERTMEVWVHYKELSKSEISKQLQNDSIRYQGWDFKKFEKIRIQKMPFLKKLFRNTIC